MKFGVKKCAVLILKRGKVVECNGIILPDGQVMKKMDENGYKYLGILEYNQAMEKEMKTIFRKEYIRRLKIVLKPKLNGRNKILAINIWAVPLLRYSGRIIRWNKNEWDVTPKERYQQNLYTKEKRWSWTY